MSEVTQRCRNCQTMVTGEYCNQCGQREGRADQRFRDLAGELLGDVFDMDSRFWRTLFFLLFRPGFLSAEFIAGRRARYLPPLRLYLVISFVVFLVMSFAASYAIDSDGGVVVQGADDVVVAADDAASDTPGDESEDTDDGLAEIDLADENSPQWLKDLDERAETNVVKIKDDPREFIEAMVSYLPQMMFLLLPVFALLVQFAYLFSSFHYLQHLVFSLHYHSFVYLLFLLAQAIELLQVHVDGWLMIALFVYLPLAFRKTYGSGWRGAVGKSIFVYLSYAVTLMMGFAGVAVLALMLL
ncbi:MAG: DUF3667 domain-containing protein [Halioglobus sp.]